MSNQEDKNKKTPTTTPAEPAATEQAIEVLEPTDLDGVAGGVLDATCGGNIYKCGGGGKMA
jgi:hypothetical protein